MQKSMKYLLFLVYLLIGLYQINSAFNFVTLPSFFNTLDKWIIFIGGLLIVWGGINHLRVNKYSV